MILPQIDDRGIAEAIPRSRGIIGHEEGPVKRHVLVGEYGPHVIEVHLRIQPTAAGEFGVDSIDFPTQLASVPTAHFIKLGESPAARLACGSRTSQRR